MNITDPESDNWWVCKIGPVKRKKIPMGGDMIPRTAVESSIIDWLPDSYTCYSGWGYSTEEVKAMNDAPYIKEEITKLKQMTFLELFNWWKKNQQQNLQE